MKLNATLLLQLINFILLYWILRVFFLRHALAFFFAKRNEREALLNETARLEKKDLKTKQNYTTLIANFKSKMAVHEPTIAPPLLQITPHITSSKEEVFDTAYAKTITEKLQSIIEKECNHES